MKALKVRATQMGVYGLKRHYPADSMHKRAGEPFLLVPRKGWRKDEFGKKHAITLTAEQQFSAKWMEKLGVVDLDRAQVAAHHESRPTPQEHMLRDEIAELKSKLARKTTESAQLKQDASDAKIPLVPEEGEIPEQIPQEKGSPDEKGSPEKDTAPTGEKDLI